MSAYMTCVEHRSALAFYAVRKQISGDYGHGELDSMKRVFAMLTDANVASLRARYPKDADFDDGDTFIEPRPNTRYAPIDIIVAAKCFRYQACEFDGWESSQAAALIERIISHAIGELPGYNEAKWGAPKVQP